MNSFSLSVFFVLVLTGHVLFSQSNSKQTGDSQLRNLININGTLFFAAKDSSHGVELWKSNGTAAGTMLVKDIYVGSIGSSPSNFINLNGVLFFTANNGSGGIELWKSNGTYSGTSLVKDIYPGPGSSAPSYLVNLNGMLYFAANDSIHNNELWRSDGTTAGTVLVKDINLEPNDVGLYNKLQVNKSPGIYGEQELWKPSGNSVEMNRNPIGSPLPPHPRRQNAKAGTESKRGVPTSVAK